VAIDRQPGNWQLAHADPSLTLYATTVLSKIKVLRVWVIGRKQSQRPYGTVALAIALFDHVIEGALANDDSLVQKVEVQPEGFHPTPTEARHTLGYDSTWTGCAQLRAFLGLNGTAGSDHVTRHDHSQIMVQFVPDEKHHTSQETRTEARHTFMTIV
jgi:hypothetical protein